MGRSGPLASNEWIADKIGQALKDESERVFQGVFPENVEVERLRKHSSTYTVYKFANVQGGRQIKNVIVVKMASYC